MLSNYGLLIETRLGHVVILAFISADSRRSLGKGGSVAEFSTSPEAHSPKRFKLQISSDFVSQSPKYRRFQSATELQHRRLQIASGLRFKIPIVQYDRTKSRNLEHSDVHARARN